MLHSQISKFFRDNGAKKYLNSTRKILDNIENTLHTDETETLKTKIILHYKNKYESPRIYLLLLS